jgi:hypothetical protein
MVSKVINIKEAWLTLWNSSNGRSQIFLTATLSIFVCCINFHYLAIWEARKGVLIDDKLLAMLTPVDFSVPIFFMMYSVVILGIVLLLNEPEYLLKALQAYMLMLFLRTITIFFIPLEPPVGMIMLIDPFGQLCLGKDGLVVTKDLFFSGHTGALFIYYFATKNKWLKHYITLCCLAVPLMLVWQHVHYTLDVIAAPFASFFCIKLVDRVYKKAGHEVVLFEE